MLTITIPGFGDLKLEHAVFDYNGTLAISGLLIPDVEAQLNALSNHLQVHIITGDSFGKAKEELAGTKCQLTILPSENQGMAKEKYIERLNSSIVVAIGNGRNDFFMLKKACLGIAVIGDEGAAREAIEAADVVAPNIHKALDLLNEPRKLIATLRS
jgi:P-type E1-E2 ATPase